MGYVLVEAVGRDDLPGLKMPTRFRHEVTYFMSVAGEPGVPALGPNEYFIRLTDAQRVLDEGVFRLVSPLDSANRAAIDLSEEQEIWLEWLTAHAIEHIRLTVLSGDGP